MLAGELLGSCMDASIERIEWGVPALEVDSLVGDKLLARSEKSISTCRFAGIRVSCSAISLCTDQLSLPASLYAPVRFPSPASACALHPLCPVDLPTRGCATESRSRLRTRRPRTLWAITIRCVRHNLGRFNER